MKKITELFKRYTANEYVLFLVTATAFIHIYVNAAVIVLLPFYALFTGQFKKCLPKKKPGYLFLLFALIALVLTFLYSKNIYAEAFHLPSVNASDSMLWQVQISSFYMKGLSVLIVGLFFGLHFFSNTMTKRAWYANLKLASALSLTSFAAAVIQMIKNEWVSVDRPGRVASVFSNENYYATVMEFVFLIGLFFFTTQKNRKRRLFYALVMASSLAGVFFSGCRTALFCIFAGSVLYFFFTEKKIFWCLLSLAFLGAGAFLIYDLTHSHALFTLLTNGIQYRLSIWKTSWAAFTDQIWGRGFYSYGYTHPAYGGAFAIHAHNLYLDLLLNFGVAGFLCLIGFFLFSAKELFSSLKKSRLKPETGFCAACLLCVILHGLTDVTLIWTQTAVFPALILLCPSAFEAKEVEK